MAGSSFLEAFLEGASEMEVSSLQSPLGAFLHLSKNVSCMEETGTKRNNADKFRDGCGFCLLNEGERKKADSYS